MSKVTYPHVRTFAALGMIDRFADVKKSLNTSGRIVEGMAAPRVMARFPHLRDVLKQGVNAAALVAMIDLSPFSKVAAELEADEIAGFLDQYYSEVVKAVEGKGGVVEKYIGDAVLALFGKPFTPSTTTEQLFDVVEMAKVLIANAGEWFSGEVCAKVAVAFGNCFFGYVGPEEHVELTVVGNPLTTLFRLEAVCEPNQVIMLKDLFDRRPEARVKKLQTGVRHWVPEERFVMLRGVSEQPVEVTTLTYRGGR